MHERIIILGDSPVSATEFISCYPWFLGSVADYVADLETSVEEELGKFSSIPGIFFNSEECILEIQDAEAYFKSVMTRFNRVLNTNNPFYATCKWGYAMSAKDVLNDKFGTYILYDSALYTLSEFLYYENEGGNIYKVQNILDYHY